MTEEIEFYVTQTRTHYPDQGGVEIYLYGRTEDGEPEHALVQGFEPYFYVPVSEVHKLEPKDHSGIKRVEVSNLDGARISPADAGRTGFPTVVDEDELPVTESINGETLARVVTTHPGAVPQLRDQYDTTYEADVLFTNRLRIDHEVYSGVRLPSRTVTPDQIEPVEITDAPVRYCYFDIEIDDRDSMPVQNDEVIHTDSAVTSIVAYDSYDEEYVAFVNLDERPPAEVFPDLIETQEPPGCLDTIQYDYNEQAMLKSFFVWIGETNPDVLLAWNNLGFDMPYLIERANSLGVDPGRMGRGPDATASYGHQPEVSGRAVYDLMKAWERMKYTEVPTALDDAADIELGASKITHERSLYELWQDDTAELLEYNARDVRLMVDINDTAGVLRDREELKDTVGLDYEQTYEANSYIEMLARRMLAESGVAGPTKTAPSGGGDYEGAYTFPAFEGREHNVVSIDLASLYPFVMWMLNSSPETLVEVVDDVDAELPLDPDDGFSIAPNGAKFDRSEDGLFKSLVDKALELTRQAGRRRDEHPSGSEMWEYWNSVRESRKRIRNGLYGVLGWEWFFLYDEPVAESVTTLAQVAIKRTAEYINEETVGEVIYGDTDSTYISWPDDLSITECLERTHEVVETLNTEVYPSLVERWGIPRADCELEIEMEDASTTFFQAGSKKRYAKQIVWKEGMDFDARLDDGSIEIKGFETKRSDTAELTSNLQKEVLRGIVTGEDEPDLRRYVFHAAQSVQRRYPDWDLIGISGGIGKPLDEYDSDTAQVRAAKAGNQLLGLDITQGDKPKRVYIEERPVEQDGEQITENVIGFTDGSELRDVEDQLYVDLDRMRDTIIKKPMQRILEPLGIDTEAAMRGKEQKDISDWV